MPRLRIEPTADQLLAAWQNRRRRHWPDSYAAAMADPLLSRLVHMEAVLAVLRAQRALQRQQQAPKARREPARMPAAHSSIDLKRRAAGDTDHDD